MNKINSSIGKDNFDLVSKEDSDTLNFILNDFQEVIAGSSKVNIYIIYNNSILNITKKLKTTSRSYNALGLRKYERNIVSNNRDYFIGPIDKLFDSRVDAFIYAIGSYKQSLDPTRIIEIKDRATNDINLKHIIGNFFNVHKDKSSGFFEFPWLSQCTITIGGAPKVVSRIHLDKSIGDIDSDTLTNLIIEKSDLSRIQAALGKGIGIFIVLLSSKKDYTIYIGPTDQCVAKESAPSARSSNNVALAAAIRASEEEAAKEAEEIAKAIAAIDAATAATPATAAPETVNATPAAVAAPALPPEWVSVVDSEGRTYYYNRSTTESTWERPAPPVVGWSEAIDPGSKKPYYVHTNGRPTQWEKPANFNSGPTAASANAKANSKASTVPVKAKANAGTPTVSVRTWWLFHNDKNPDLTQKNSKFIKLTGTLLQDKKPTEIFNKAQLNKTFDNILEKDDDKQQYTIESSSTPVQKYRIKSVFSEFGKEIVSPTQTIVREVKADPDYFIGPLDKLLLLLPLPEGWTEQKSPEGKTFYHHTDSKRSQWERPKAEDPLPLPEGWTWGTDNDGTIYYISPGGESTWNDPRKNRGGRRKPRKSRKRRVSFRRRPRSGTRYRVKSK
jgi:hypothetical protein